MLQKIITLFFFTTITITILQNCDTTEPKDNNQPDTTSQNFTFETYEFGDGFSSSYFNDVWIFDENNIWAVGEVYLEDGYTNIMRWNGEKWYPQRPYLTSSGIVGVWASDSSNIYFASGAVRKYENGKIIEYDLGHLGFTQGQAVHKLWGSNENNIWGVGPWGTIVHYDGKEWKKIEFDNQWYFTDISGNNTDGTGYAVAVNNQFTTIIVELRTTSQLIIYSSEERSTSPSVAGILVLDDYLKLSSSEIWSYNLKTMVVKLDLDLTEGYGLISISGKSVNDTYFFGNKYNYGELFIHYNGERYTEFKILDKEYLINKGSDAITNLAVLVGYYNNKAYLLKIKRE